MTWSFRNGMDVPALNLRGSAVAQLPDPEMASRMAALPVIAGKRSPPTPQPSTPHEELGSMRSHRFPYLSVNTATVPYAACLGSSSNSTPRLM